MLTLTLFRHAKSSWKSGANSDHDRPLNKRGLADAPVMAQRLLARDCLPNRCLVSTAKRTRETVAALIDQKVVASDSVDYLSELYLSSPETILEAVQADFLMQSSANAHIMVIAHNPGLETLADALSGSRTGAMPTCAVASFRVNAADFSVVHSANSQLNFFDAPKL